MRFARRRLHHPEDSDVRRLALSCSGHVTVPFALRQLLLELLLDAEGIGRGACPEFPQRMPIVLAPAHETLMVFPALAEKGDDAVGELAVNISRRRDAAHSAIVWRGSLPDAGDSKWGAGNLLRGARSGPFASARTRKRACCAASSRSACHPITRG